MPVASTKSKAEEMRSEMFRRHQQHGKEMDALLGAKPTDVLIDLQRLREKVCVEIEALMKQLNDATLTDEELANLNQEVNRKFQLRWTIEDDIRQATRGAQDFTFGGDRNKFRFFGQAKRLEVAAEGGDGPLDPKTLLREFRAEAAEEEDLEAAIVKALDQSRPLKKPRKALFEDSSSSSSD